VTTASWSYVPAFLVVELWNSMPNEQALVEGIILSAVMNIIFYIGVGATCVLAWGWNLDDPITIVAAWPSESNMSRSLNAFLLVANLIG
jgi:hypothetical protein